MTGSITINVDDGSFTAYRADPAGTPRGAIVVIQEIFGINAGIRRQCDLFAEAGYLAIAPDLFWRFAAGVELDPDVKPEFERALQLMGQLDQDAAIRDLETTIRTVRGMLPEDGKVGAVGFCLGGRLAFMVAARTDVDASVGYYGVGIDGLLGEKHGIARPLMLHIPVEDHFVDHDAQARIHAGLDDHPKVTLHDYPGEDHGFAAAFGSRRSEEAATLAEGRTAAFFAEHLG
ncbi:dienelactone hydrolase family protein [Sphingomonas sp. CFBP 8760]|uniref:dienelactone hydrolase family protein n=1 Tax=Sphingomonas sp. CFBP 8760 TaxID=2775282 RepID=UPI00178388E9|nr:dienelactone hydrolase family protein [Sphingomonas sp. CFBP 8760]MBD8547279.1 dienelactone hydrolase family protein [Sphingomonas sp. CFBP 8760]